MDVQKYVYDYLPNDLVKLLNNINFEKYSLQEIRIRKDSFVVLIVNGTTYFLSENGLNKRLSSNCYKISKIVFDEIVQKMCENSFYSYVDMLKQGYITLKNGCRVGVCSTAVYDNNLLKTVRDITSLNIRIASQIKGCSKIVLDRLYNEKTPSIIVAGMPSSGKTTFLRDMAYQLSNGYNDRYLKLCLIDGRNEFAGKIADDFSLDVGVNTDVISGFSKEQGIDIAIRTMSPQLIVCDEISSDKELDKIRFGFSCGVSFAVSVHIGNIEDLYNKPLMKQLLLIKQFDYIVLLDDKFNTSILNTQEVQSEIHRRCSNSDNINNDSFDKM